MSLRKQLALFSLLTLVLPWAGFRYIQAMEAALRNGLEQSLMASAQTMAQVLAGADGAAALLPPIPGPANGAAAYAHALATSPQIDGSRDDWNLRPDLGVALGTQGRYWIGVDRRFAYIFVESEDSQLIYQRSAGPTLYGDRLVVITEPHRGAANWFVFATSAPGVVRAQQTRPPLFAPTGSYDDRVLGSWRETPGGFAVEVRLPLALVGKALAFGIIDVDRDGDDYVVALAANWRAEDYAAQSFVYQRYGLQEFLRSFSDARTRARVIDTAGWALADAEPQARDIRLAYGDEGSLTEDLLRYLLRRDDPAYQSIESPAGRVAAPELLSAVGGTPVAAWYRGPLEQEAIVVAAVPIRRGNDIGGLVLLEQASDSILTTTNEALLRLLSLSMVAMLVAVAGTIGFATYLSLRVRRLARAAERALGPTGEIMTELPGLDAADEIGDLTRSFTNLLARLSEHTSYLRTLTSKLSHELRTPLAVVSTSLDNIEKEAPRPPSEHYLRRLRDGANRLDAILASMSEATLMEQAIADTAPERFEVGAVIRACCSAYGDVYPQREFRLTVATSDAAVTGSRELIAQLLDKLIDNAVGFSPQGSRIDVGLHDRNGELCLVVANRGSRLPDNMREQLFDSLVSVRSTVSSRPHLGLGLYIAALIAKFHGGRIDADNLADGSGVEFRVWLPREDPRPTGRDDAASGRR